MIQSGPHVDAYIRRMDELAEAARSANSQGHLLRVEVYIDEARADFWRASTKDFDARNLMWSKRFDTPGDIVRDRLTELARARYSSSIDLDPEGPSIESFFDCWGEEGRELSPKRGVQYTRQIDETEARLGIKITGLLRDVYTYDNGGYTDFIYYPLSPWSPLSATYETGMAKHPFWDHWEEPFPDRKLVSVQYWKTVERIMTETDDKFRTPEYGSEEPGEEWKGSLEGLDKLVVVSMREGKHDSVKTMFCFDFRHPGEPGCVLVTERQPFGGQLEVVRQWPPFSRFFKQLRSPAIQEYDGIVRMRGSKRVVEIFENGKWRAPRG